MGWGIMVPFEQRAPVRARLMLIAAASYAALYVILLTQALRGVPLIAADSTVPTWSSRHAHLDALIRPLVASPTNEREPKPR